MNKIVKISILAVATLFTFTSCMKDVEPTYLVTSDQASSSEIALEGMVGAVKTSMIEVGSVFDGAVHYDFSYPALLLATDALAGEFVVTSTDGNAGYDHFSAWSTHQYLGPLYYAPYFFWSCYYTFIKAANDVISVLSTDEELSTEKQVYLAAAKAYRASFYLDMARLYDPFENDYTSVGADIIGLTVPYVSETTTEADARDNPRLPRDDMFEKIFEDLAAAEEIFTQENVNPSAGTSPNLAVVYGLYARAYLWLGGFDSSYYATAIEYADLAIASSKATITTEEQWTSTSSGFNSAIGSWMWYLTQSSDSISNLINYVAWVAPEGTWGYDNLICFGARSSDYDRMGSNDIRKSVIIGSDVDYSQYSSVTSLEEDDFSNLYAYTNLKFRPVGGETSDYTSGNPSDIVIMRVEEMYFIKAEATAHTDAAAGLAILAQVMASRDSGYSTTGVEDAIEEIIFQKRMEFWGEGIILYDLKRLGYGVKTGYSGTNVCSDYRFNVDGIMPSWNLCLPNSEIYQNTALVQNPDPSSKVTVWTE